MTLPEEAELFRIFVGESDKHRGRSLWEVTIRERIWALSSPRTGPVRRALRSNKSSLVRLP